MKRALLASLAALSLAACVTPTVYGPINPQGVGFSEYRIQDNRYRVTFQGGGGAPRAQVEDYALLRAAELTLRDGYDWFRVIDRRGEVVGGGSPRMSLGVGGSNYGYGYRGGSSVGVGVGTSFDLSGGPRMAVSLEVLLGRGARPEEAYDARQIVRSIGEGRPPGPLPVARAQGGASV
jgi:hypothetical protein